MWAVTSKRIRPLCLSEREPHSTQKPIHNDYRIPIIIDTYLILLLLQIRLPNVIPCTSSTRSEIWSIRRRAFLRIRSSSLFPLHDESLRLYFQEYIKLDESTELRNVRVDLFPPQAPVGKFGTWQPGVLGFQRAEIPRFDFKYLNVKKKRLYQNG